MLQRGYRDCCGENITKFGCRRISQILRRHQLLPMIKNLAKSALRALGLEVRRYRPPTPSRLRAFAGAWSRLNPPPSFIIDIGANHGAWTRSVIDIFPDAEFLMIEPQERLKVHSKDLLQRSRVRWLTAGINDQSGSLLLTIPPRDDSASFRMSEADAKAHGYSQVEVPVTTLDEIVAQKGQVPQLVKIDAEGFDLRALRGASTLLGTTEVFFVECGIATGLLRIRLRPCLLSCGIKAIASPTSRD